MRRPWLHRDVDEGAGVDRDKLLSEEKVQVGNALIEVGRVLRRYAVGLIAFGLVVVVPLELLGAALTSNNPDLPRTGAPVGTDLLSGLIKLEPLFGDALVLLIGLPLIAGTTVLLTAARQVDRTPDVPTAIGAAVRRSPWLVLVSLVLALGIGIVAVIAGLLDLLIPGILPTGGIGDVVASVVLLAGLATLLPYAVVAYPAAVLQRATAGQTVRSAITVARDDFVMLLGRGIAVFVVASILGTVARFIVMLIVGLISTGPFAQAIGEAVADVVFIPVFAAGATLVYLDTQGRRGETDRQKLEREVDAVGG